MSRWGVLPGLSPSLTFSSIYDGVDVTVTSMPPGFTPTMTWLYVKYTIHLRRALHNVGPPCKAVDADRMVIKGYQQNIQKLDRGSKMRRFETNENEAIDSPTPRNEAKTPYCKRYNPVMELTTVRARGQVCTYGIPVVIRLRKHEMRDN